MFLDINNYKIRIKMIVSIYIYILYYTIYTIYIYIYNNHTEHLANFKWLRGGIEFIDVIPKSASGKILRRTLVERYNK